MPRPHLLHSDDEDEEAPATDSEAHNVVSVWLPAGSRATAARYAFAYITPAACSADLTPAAAFIRSALEPVLGTPPTPGAIPFELLPSSRSRSRGAMMLLRFRSADDRDSAVRLSPFKLHGGQVTLERAEEDGGNRLFLPAPPPRLALVAVKGFPLEHWFPSHIRAAFRGVGRVREIDPACLDGGDFTSVRVVLELEEGCGVPEELCLRRPGGGGEGVIARVQTVKVWPRAARFDVRGQYVPVFRHPPPGTGSWAGSGCRALHLPTMLSNFR